MSLEEWKNGSGSLQMSFLLLIPVDRGPFLPSTPFPIPHVQSLRRLRRAEEGEGPWGGKAKDGPLSHTHSQQKSPRRQKYGASEVSSSPSMVFKKG